MTLPLEQEALVEAVSDALESECGPLMAFDGRTTYSVDADTLARAIIPLIYTAGRRAGLEEMRELLKPFAEAADDLDDKHRDASPIWEAPAAMSIDAGDLRRAQAAIRSISEQEKSRG